MATNQNNTNNKNKDPFIEELDAAIKKLDSLDKAIDTSNGHMSDLGDSFKKLAEGINSLDGRKARKLETISKNIKSVLDILNNYKAGNLEIVSGFINEFVKSINDLNKLEIDMTNIDSFAQSMEGINNQLKDFIKLSKGLGAVNLSKLEKLNIEIKQEDGTKVKATKKTKQEDTEKQKLDKAIKRNPYTKWSLSEIEKAMHEVKNDLHENPNKRKYETYSKMKFAHNIVENTEMSDDEQIKLMDKMHENRIKYNKYVNNYQSKKAEARKLNKNKDNIDVINAKTELAKQKEQAKADAAKQKEQAKADAAKQTYDARLEFEKEKQKIKEEAEERKKKAAEAKKDAAAKAKADAEAEKINREIIELEEQLNAGTDQIRVVNRLTELKSKRGDFLFPVDENNITDDEYTRAAQAKEVFRKNTEDRLISKNQKDYDSEIERAQKNKEEKAAVNQASREIINNRTYKNAQAKYDKAVLEQQFNQDHLKEKAISNILTKTFGINSAALNDVMALLPIFDKQAKEIQRLKDNRNVIEQKYNLDNRALTNEEITETRKIKAEGLSEEQKKLLNNPNLSEEQRNKILDSSLSNQKVVDKLNDLRNRTEEKRTKLIETRDKDLLENEKALGVVSKQAAGNLTQFIVAFKLLKRSLSELYKVSKLAAQANTSMAASLKSMGASSSEVSTDSIKYFTNELENISQRLKTIGREFGETFEGAFAGWTLAFDKILGWVEDTVTELNNLLPDSLKLEAESKKIINYSTLVLENTAEKLNKGLNVNGVEIKVDKEIAYRALSSSFGTSKTQGFDNNSSANLASGISSLASKIQANYGVDYSSATQALNDAIFNGSNSASAYGIVIDDQILAGYAAMEKELDIVNVEYTDAYKSALRYEMAEKMMADGNSKEMQDKIKKWKQLGDVIQTASGQLFDFQEVQSIEAKDFTIPEVGLSGADGESIKKINEEMAKQGNFLVYTANGMMTLDEALEYTAGDLSRFQLLLDKTNREYRLAVDDYLPTLTDEYRNNFEVVAKGIPAIVGYADYIGLADYALYKIAEQAGLSKEELTKVQGAIENINNNPIDWSNSEDVKNKLDDTQKKVEETEQGFDTFGVKVVGVFGDIAEGIVYVLTLLSELAKDTATFGANAIIRKITLGSDNMFAWDFAKNVSRPIEYNTSAVQADLADNGKVDNGFLQGIKEGYYNEFSDDGIVGAILSKVGGHYDGGISTKEHIARISEGNTNEAIINLDSQQGINALSAAMSLALQGQTQQGINVEKIEVKNEGINIGDDMKWRKVAQRLADEMATLDRERGVINNGIK